MHAAEDEDGDILRDQDLQDVFDDYDEEEEFEVDSDLDDTYNQPPPAARMSTNYHRPPGRGAGAAAARGGLTSPPGRGRTPRRAAAAAAAAGGNDPPQDEMDGLAQGMNNVQLASPTPTRFVAFSFNTVVPFKIIQTPLVDGERTCMVDFHVQSIFQDKHAVSLSSNGLRLFLQTESLRKYVRPSVATLGEHFALQGDRDAIISGYEEVEDKIVEAHGQGPYCGDPQVVILPFACQQNFELDVAWDEGDDQLSDWCAGEGLPPQMMPVLRIVLKSINKSRSRVGIRSRALASAPRMPPPPPPPAGGFGGGGGGYGGGGGGYGGGGGDGGFGGGGYGGGGDDYGTSRRVPTGVVAEALRRAARFASRDEAERTGGHSHSAGMTSGVTSSSAPLKSDGEDVPATAAVTPNKTEAV